LSGALVCAAAGLVLFQFFGNAAQGYVKSDSLFWWWVSQWLDPRAEAEHGWLILGLSGWLWWRNLRQSAGGRVENAVSVLPAVVALVAGLALHTVGFVAQQGRISILGLLLFLWGVVRLAGGRRWGAAALFPLGFMVFAIPLNVIDEVGLPLRLWVTSAGHTVAHAAGIEVLRSGTQLLSPDGRFNYDVAAPCSGVRSLVALAALSLLVGYLEFRSKWRRALVLAVCFPLIYVGNVARIVAIIFAAQIGGPKWGNLTHEVMGYGVFVIVLGGVLGVVAFLRRVAPESPPPADLPAAPIPPPTPPTPPASAALDVAPNPASTVARAPQECNLLGYTLPGRLTRWRAFGVAGLIVVLAVGDMMFLRHVARTPGRGQVGVALAADGLNPVELPAFLGTEWIGRRTEVTAVEREILPVDTGYSRKLYVAVADARQQVLLSIVLSGRDRTSIHRPELCLVGQGWTIGQAAQHRFAGPGRDESFSASLLRVRREVQSPQGKVVVPQLVAYWFINGDRIVASHGQRFLADAWNRVFRGRADRWAYVLMQTDASDGEAAALARMQAVLAGTLTVFAPPKPKA
jgi:exosortase